MINKLPVSADTEVVELLQFQIGKVKLVFCNFTVNTVCVDSAYNIYMNDRLQDQYSAQNSHTVLYHVKKDPPPLWADVCRLKKEDRGKKIEECAFGRTMDYVYSWMKVPLPTE